MTHRKSSANSHPSLKSYRIPRRATLRSQPQPSPTKKYSTISTTLQQAALTDSGTSTSNCTNMYTNLHLLTDHKKIPNATSILNLYLSVASTANDNTKNWESVVDKCVECLKEIGDGTVGEGIKGMLVGGKRERVERAIKKAGEHF